MSRQYLDRYMIDGIEMEWLEEFNVSVRRHIAYVLVAGTKLNVPEEQLYIHDDSKFSIAEFPYYARQFHGDKADPAGFAVAWLHHQNSNPHHWEFWITRSDHSKGASGAIDGCLPMPENYVREMIADWMGASMAYTGSWDMAEWLTQNVPRMRMHPETRGLVSGILKRELGYQGAYWDAVANTFQVYSADYEQPKRKAILP